MRRRGIKMIDWVEKELWTLSWQEAIGDDPLRTPRLELKKKMYSVFVDEDGINVANGNCVVIGMSQKEFDRTYAENPKSLVGHVKKYLQEFMLPVYEYQLKEANEKIKMLKQYFEQNKNTP
jgi:hypothetical protein